MLGSLGQVSAIGLGISLKTKRETIVLDGDGSLLMSSILPTIGTKKPRNLSIICLDNGTWGSTGDQPTQSFGLVDLELMAINAGIEDTIKVHTEKELKSALERLYDEEGPRFVHVIINIKLTPKQIKRRFMKAMAMPLIAL
jgi:sulfopyruvate decarboxylase subunit beta